MSPVAADFASADSAPTAELAVVVGAEGEEEAGCCVERVLELDDPEDPQPAPSAAIAEHMMIIVGWNMAGNPPQLT